MRCPRNSRDRRGFGFWVVAVVVIVLLLAVAGGASNFQNRQLYRDLIESDLGRVALHAAGSAIEEVYWKLSRNMLTPLQDPRIRLDWPSVLLEVPDGSQPVEIVAPEVTRSIFEGAPDFATAVIDDVAVRLVHREMDVGLGFWSGAVELEAAVTLRVGGYSSGVGVVRRVRVRKRYFAVQGDSTQSPTLRFLPEDISREVLRS